ncbi:MAG: hypothetical protein JO210_14475 [Acidobacteriaceae bacterium]|nr:hypothetical protein [Acidobacteriaceae bacterium]
MDWTPEQQHKMELMQRYKTTAERAFYRAWSALQGLGKDIMRRDKDYEAMRLRVAKHELREEAQKLKAEKESAPRSRDAAAQSRCAPKTKKIVTLDQWVEIEVSPAGKTVTTLHPSNETLKKDLEKKWPAPELVYRRLHFVHGVPHEYAWATSDARIRATGGMGIQRMAMDTWLELIEEEKEFGTGHLLPCGNLPRPEERGGCDCAVCSRNRAILEARG